MKCIECGATGCGLHHSAACKYCNVDIYAKVNQLKADIDRMAKEIEQQRAENKRLDKLVFAYESVNAPVNPLLAENKQLKELLRWIDIHQVHSHLCAIQFTDTEEAGCTCEAKEIERRIERVLKDPKEE